MTKFSLSTVQRERAELILEELEENSRIPESHFPEWEEAMSWGQFDQRIDSDVHKRASENKMEKWVPPANIVGPLGNRIDPVEKTKTRAQDVKWDRLERIIGWMVDGEFEIDNDGIDIPQYAEFDGDFYVTAEGRHRSIACKAVGIERIWGEVSVIR